MVFSDYFFLFNAVYSALLTFIAASCLVENCLECHSFDERICKKCPDGYFIYNFLCEKCDPGCSTCLEFRDLCLDCSPGYIFDESNKQKCQLICSEGCASCDNYKSNCTSCVPGYYFSDFSCQICSGRCKTCENTSNNCTDCNTGLLISENQCFCEDKNKYYNTSVGKCLQCNTACTECMGSSERNCTKCSPPMVLAGHQCLIDSSLINTTKRNRLTLEQNLIMYYQFINEDTIEISLHNKYTGWIGIGFGYSMRKSYNIYCLPRGNYIKFTPLPADQDFLLLMNSYQNSSGLGLTFRIPRKFQLDASEDFFIENEVPLAIVWALGLDISSGYHGSHRGVVFTKLSRSLVCDVSCHTCFGPEIDNCLTCIPGFFLDKDLSTCNRCHLSCASCYGSGIRECLSCSEDESRKFINGMCVDPDGMMAIYKSTNVSTINDLIELSDYAGVLPFLFEESHRNSYKNNFCLNKTDCSTSGICTRFICRCSAGIKGMHCEKSEEVVNRCSSLTTAVFDKLESFNIGSSFSQYIHFKSIIYLLDSILEFHYANFSQEQVILTLDFIKDFISVVLVQKRDKENLAEAALRVILRCLEISVYDISIEKEDLRQELIDKQISIFDMLIPFWVQSRTININTLFLLEISLNDIYVGHYQRDSIRNLTSDYYTVSKGLKNVTFPESFFRQILNISQSQEFYFFLIFWATSPFEKFEADSSLFVSEGLNISVKDKDLKQIEFSFPEPLTAILPKKLRFTFASDGNEVSCQFIKSQDLENAIYEQIIKENEDSFACKIKQTGYTTVRFRPQSEIRNSDQTGWKLQNNYGFGMIVSLYVLFFLLSIYFYFITNFKIKSINKAFSTSGDSSPKASGDGANTPNLGSNNFRISVNTLNSENKIPSALPLVKEDLKEISEEFDFPKEMSDHEVTSLKNMKDIPVSRERSHDLITNQKPDYNTQTDMTDDDQEEVIEEILSYSIWNLHPIYAIIVAKNFKLKMSYLALIYSTFFLQLTILSIEYDMIEYTINSEIDQKKMFELAMMTQAIMWPLNYLLGLLVRCFRKRLKLSRFIDRKKFGFHSWKVSINFWIIFFFVCFFCGIIIIWKLSYLRLSDLWLGSFLLVQALEYVLADPLLVLLIKLLKITQQFDTLNLLMKLFKYRGFYTVKKIIYRT